MRQSRCYNCLIVALVLVSTTLLGQQKWDLDSVYLAEFGPADTTAEFHLPALAFHLPPLGAFVGVLEGQVEARLTPRTSVLFGGSHLSYLYRYGQPNDPEKSFLLNHYGNYIYEEWIFENFFSADFRYYWRSRRGNKKPLFVALTNRFVTTRWDYTNVVISNPYYDPNLDELWDGPAPWIPLDFDLLTRRTAQSMRTGVMFGRRYDFPLGRFFNFHEWSVAGTLRYDPWEDRMLVVPSIRWSLVY